MKKHLINLLLIVGASLAIAQTIDIMSQKVAGANQTPAKAATTTAVGSYAIIDKDNNIIANGYDGTLQFDGATYDRFKTTFAITDPTASRTITFPNSSGTVALNPLGASMEFEGATANAYETTLAVTDPTADRTATLPDVSGTVMLSSLSTNGQDAANSIWGASNGLVLEGATADAHEITIAPADATADVIYQLPDAPAGTYPVVANVVQARTTTADGLTTGTISAGVNHVTVTSGGANEIIILPAPVVGAQIVIHAGATGFELRSSAPATIAINAGSGADAESAIAADSTCFLTCVSATAWKGYFMDADGDVAKIEAAAP